jgi:probable phosphoglycerate mutase
MVRFVYVARHGETDWNAEGRWQGHTDVPLNDRGRAQAKVLADALRDAGLAVLVTSDLSRAHETGRIVADRLAIHRHLIDPGLRERRFGVFEGLTREECALHHPEPYRAWSKDPKKLPPGAELQHELVARIGRAMRGVVQAANDHGTPLVVTHGGALRALLREVGQKPGLIPNAGLYRFEHDGEAVRAAEEIRVARASE